MALPTGTLQVFGSTEATVPLLILFPAIATVAIAIVWWRRGPRSFEPDPDYRGRPLVSINWNVIVIRNRRMRAWVLGACLVFLAAFFGGAFLGRALGPAENVGQAPVAPVGSTITVHDAAYRVLTAARAAGAGSGDARVAIPAGHSLVQLDVAVRNGGSSGALPNYELRTSDGVIDEAYEAAETIDPHALDGVAPGTSADVPVAFIAPAGQLDRPLAFCVQAFGRFACVRLPALGSAG